MILQSELDRLNPHKRLKTLLIILTAIGVAVVLFIVIRAGREDIVVPTSVSTGVVRETPEEEVFSSEEIAKKLEELSGISGGMTPPSAPSPEEAQKRLEELSRASDGTTLPQPSAEEIMKRLNELSAKK